MSTLNSPPPPPPPPPPPEEDGAKKPWRKPTMYDLTEVLDTGGAPTLKDDATNTYEDEGGSPGQGKQYRPVTV